MQNVNGLSCVGCSAGMLSEIHTKAYQHCRAKRLFVDNTIHNDLLQELINKAIVSFRNRLWSCVAAVGEHSEHCLNRLLSGLQAADIHHWKFETFVLLMKSYAKLDLLFLNIQCRNCACSIENKCLANAKRPCEKFTVQLCALIQTWRQSAVVTKIVTVCAQYSECQREEFQKARVNGGSNYDSRKPLTDPHHMVIK